MCMLCDDEKAYQAYMDYLDAMERQGKFADPDKAMDVVLDKMQAADQAKFENANSEKRKSAIWDAPQNDKTLSPFFCSPVNK